MEQKAANIQRFALGVLQEEWRTIPEDSEEILPKRVQKVPFVRLICKTYFILVHILNDMSKSWLRCKTSCIWKKKRKKIKYEIQLPTEAWLLHLVYHPKCKTSINVSGLSSSCSIDILFLFHYAVGTQFREALQETIHSLSHRYYCIWTSRAGRPSKGLK